jgi:hypothetical protein
MRYDVLLRSALSFDWRTNLIPIRYVQFENQQTLEKYKIWTTTKLKLQFH